MTNIPVFSVLVFILGLCIGSFLNVVIYRYPKISDSEAAEAVTEWLEEKSIPVPAEVATHKTPFNLAFPASHCPSCQNKLKWYHNIPVLSYMFLGGKCGFCKTKISPVYPFIELLTAFVFLFAYLFLAHKSPNPYLILAGLFFFGISYTLALIDIKTMLLPDNLNYILLWSGLILSTFGIGLGEPQDPSRSILSAATGFMIFWVMATVGKLLKKQDVMGGGDLKLIAALGAFTGIPGVVFTIFASPVIGIATYLIHKFLLKKETPQFPYGPSLIFTCWFYIIFKQQIYGFFLQ